MVRRRGASSGLRLQSAIPVLFTLIIPSSIDAYACDAGQKEYFGGCIAVTPPAPKLLKLLKD